MAKIYETEDGIRIAALGDLGDYEVAKGYPDIRGWRVDSVDGREVGRVHELLVDVDVLRTRYLDVRLTSEVAATPGDRDVLVPIGAAKLDEPGKRVVVPLQADRISLLPPFEHGGLTRAHEYEVRRHFSLGEAAAAAGASAVTGRDFYDERYDDRRFFAERGGTAAVPGEPLSARPQPTDADVRIPLSPDDTVVLKKDAKGNDEVIIRRPVTGEDAS